MFSAFDAAKRACASYKSARLRRENWQRLCSKADFSINVVADALESTDAVN